MVRTQIYLTDKERTDLLELARSSGKKQSELIREAIDLFLEQSESSRRKVALERLAGMWCERTDLPDFAALRTEWDRTKKQ